MKSNQMKFKSVLQALCNFTYKDFVTDAFLGGDL